ncbi:MAG: response regulator transcription factor [Bacteroidales bacterium]|jgi:DNA-binding NarL/FixJ family response regulator|nr:response regulator transcription factor [Bacteroidales bacterium]
MAAYLATTFILADNQDISKAGIRYLLQETGFHGTVCDAHNKAELIQLLFQNRDATVVLDYTNFDFNNVEDMLVVSSRFTEANWMLFSDELSLPFLKRVRAEEAFSVLLKNSEQKEIEHALITANNYQRYICPRIQNFIDISRHKEETEQIELTASEQEILKLIALGKSVKEIAAERFSSVHTITTHKKNIFRKLEVNNVHEATKYALRSGLVDALEYYI